MKLLSECNVFKKKKLGNAIADKKVDKYNLRSTSLGDKFEEKSYLFKFNDVRLCWAAFIATINFRKSQSPNLH